MVPWLPQVPGSGLEALTSGGGLPVCVGSSPWDTRAVLGSGREAPA